MRSLGNVSLTPELALHVGLPKGISTSPTRIGAADAYPAKSFRDLIEHIARLAILNKDTIFYYRGQAVDYRNQVGRSTLYPTIYRGANVSQVDISSRFTLLRSAANALFSLIQNSKLEGKEDIRKRLVQWSLLQHYEICGTPLLDLTSSIRVACSFALLRPDVVEPTVYVCGMPYTSGRISVNSEHDTINVRLLGICPPAALRPLLQEGHVAGTYEVEDDYDKKNKDSLDFANRLVAKFRIPSSLDFRRDVASFDSDALYPADDPLLEISGRVSQQISDGYWDEADPLGVRKRLDPAAELGYFLETWIKLEQILLDTASFFGKDVRSVGTAARVLRDKGLPEDVFRQLLRAAKIRNTAVHKPQVANEGMLLQARDEIERLTHWAEEFYRTTARQFQDQDECSRM